MTVLVACEESQTVCKAFRERGHEAYSNDIQEPSGGHPEWHIQGDAIPILGGGTITTMDGATYSIGKWDLIIAHPPCTYLSNVCTYGFSLKASSAEYVVKRWENRAKAAIFFMYFALANCDKVCVENPVGFMNSNYRKPDQIIHPYMFAESVDDTENYVTKRTCLWLRGLPKLKGNELPPPDNRLLFGQSPRGKAYTWCDSVHAKDRAKVRSKTFPGIAKAMAEQWGSRED